MTRPETQREAGRGPLGTTNTSSSPDNARIPIRTPGTLGISDAFALSNGKQRVCRGPYPVLSPIWMKLTASERDCVLRYQGMWKSVVEGRSRQQVLSGFAGFFELMGTTLYGDRVPQNLRRESPFTIMNRVYSKLCQYEYGKINKELKKAFEVMGKDYYKVMGEDYGVQTGWRYYCYLRDGYVRGGISYPYEVINQINPNVTFLGKTVWKGLHPDLATRLGKVEQRLHREGVADQVRAGLKIDLGGFVPRFQANQRTISKHAIGLAIDFEYPTNPFVTGKTATAIDALLDHLKTKGTVVSGRVSQYFKGAGGMSMADYDRLKEISDVLVAFLRKWIPKWESFQRTIAREAALAVSSTPKEDVDAVIEERNRHLQDQRTYTALETLIAVFGGIDKVKALSRHGLVTLHDGLFRAMKAEGVESGIEWKRGKDTMHFEVGTPLKHWSKMKGLTN